MTPAITLDELLAWNHESSLFWKGFLDENPAVLSLPCDIGRTKNVQEFVRHIWSVDLLWAKRIAGLEELDREKVPPGPVEFLFGLHLEAHRILRAALDDAAFDWERTLTLNVPWLPAEKKSPTLRKALAHALTHGPRHWAQLATLVRAAGHPSGFKGDLLFSSGLR
jgi:uncharacterized damage-inducible protein DinB